MLIKKKLSKDAEKKTLLSLPRTVTMLSKLMVAELNL